MKKLLFFSTVILIAAQAFAFGGGGSGRTSTFYKRHNPGVDAYGVHFHQDQTTAPNIGFVDNNSNDQNCYYDEYGVKHCNEGYVMDDTNYCTPNLCQDFHATDCTLSCDPFTGEKQIADEDTSCGNGIATCDKNGECQCPWDDEWLDEGWALDYPYVGKDGHTCCMDGLAWATEIPFDDSFYAVLNVEACGCPTNYNEPEKSTYLGTDNTTCCSDGYAYEPQYWSYTVQNKVCGCPQGRTYDERSQQCIPEGYVSYCRQTDENGDCTSWWTCLKNENTIFFDADGEPNTHGVCTDAMRYVSSNYGGDEPYGWTCNDTTLSCNGEYDCLASNKWGQCLRWNQTHYDNQGVWQYDRYGCCTQLDDDGFCTNATTYQSYYGYTDAGCIDISDLCPSGQELFVGNCVNHCSDSYMLHTYPSGECRCKTGYTQCGGFCQENCHPGLQLNTETCRCDFIPCQQGYFRVYWDASERPGECVSCNDYNAYYSAINQSNEGTIADACDACSNRETETYGYCVLKECPNNRARNERGDCVLLNCTQEQEIWNHSCVTKCPNNSFTRNEQGVCVCPEGQWALDNICGAWPECTTNSDCADGKFCQMDTSTSGGCVTAPASISTSFTSHCNETHNYIYSTTPMNYWTAANWCSYYNTQVPGTNSFSFSVSANGSFCSRCLTDWQNNWSCAASTDWQALSQTFGSRPLWVREYSTPKRFFLNIPNQNVSSTTENEKLYPVCIVSE